MIAAMVVPFGSPSIARTFDCFDDPCSAPLPFGGANEIALLGAPPATAFAFGEPTAFEGCRAFLVRLSGLAEATFFLLAISSLLDASDSIACCHCPKPPSWPRRQERAGYGLAGP